MALIFTFSSRYKRMYRKLSAELKDKSDARVARALVNEYDSILDNHPLQGEWKGYRSINVTGDYRIVFKRLPGEFYAVAIGTHAELYGT